MELEFPADMHIYKHLFAYKVSRKSVQLFQRTCADKQNPGLIDCLTDEQKFVA